MVRPCPGLGPVGVLAWLLACATLEKRGEKISSSVGSGVNGMSSF